MKKIIIFPVVVFALCISCKVSKETPKSAEEFISPFSSGQQQELFLSKYGDESNWDQITLVGPYQNYETIAKSCNVTGVKSSDTFSVKDRDDIVVMLFSKSGTFVESVPVSRNKVDFLSIKEKCIAREKANFHVVEGKVEYVSM